MRIIFGTLLAVLALSACQESMEERCAREAREYTQKHCPTLITKDVVLDSLVFHQPSQTLTYYYTVSGLLDDADNLKQHNVRDMLLKEVKNSTNLKQYKEAGYNLRYVYHSTKKKGTQLFEATFRKKDYQ